MTLMYRRPHLWEHVPASLPTEISFSPFYVTFSDGWCADNSPGVEIVFDEKGRLAEVRKRGFASSSSRVMKLQLH